MRDRIDATSPRSESTQRGPEIPDQNLFPRAGLLFTMFPNQEPGGGKEAHAHEHAHTPTHARTHSRIKTHGTRPSSVPKLPRLPEFERCFSPCLLIPTLSNLDSRPEDIAKEPTKTLKRPLSQSLTHTKLHTSTECIRQAPPGLNSQHDEPGSSLGSTVVLD